MTTFEEIKTVKLRNLIPWNTDGNAYDYNTCLPGDTVVADHVVHICVGMQSGGHHAEFVAIMPDHQSDIKDFYPFHEIVKARCINPAYHHKRVIKDTGLEEIKFTYKEITDEYDQHSRKAIKFEAVSQYIRRQKAAVSEYRKIKEFGVF